MVKVLLTLVHTLRMALRSGQVHSVSRELAAKSGGTNTIIIVVVVSVVLLVLLLIVLVYVFRRELFTSYYQNIDVVDPRPMIQEPSNEQYHANPVIKKSPQSHFVDCDVEITKQLVESTFNDPELLATRIHFNLITVDKLVSHGGYGEIWLGFYQDRQVAIKRMRQEKSSDDDLYKFIAEIKIMSRLNHPKIVQFIGSSWNTPKTICAVTEFMNCGDLKVLLDKQLLKDVLTWKGQKYTYALDTIDALAYLHSLSPIVIHRDLKCKNILIDSENGAKLSDFGISRQRTYDETMTQEIGTSRWIAPEMIAGDNYSELVDVYSFGICLSEMDTHKLPFYDVKDKNGQKLSEMLLMQQVACGKIRPSFSKNCPTSINKLANMCLQTDPALRPSAVEVAHFMRTTVKKELDL